MNGHKRKLMTQDNFPFAQPYFEYNKTAPLTKQQKQEEKKRQ
jgi:hypothetical protein